MGDEVLILAGEGGGFLGASGIHIGLWWLEGHSNQEEANVQKLETQQSLGKLRPGWLQGALKMVNAGGK